MYKSKLYQIIGYTIIIWILYRTIMIERLPYKINELVSKWILSIVIIMCIMHGITIIAIMYNIIRKRPMKINPLLIKIIEIIYYEPLRRVRDKIRQYLMMKKLIQGCASILEASIRSKYTVYLSVLIFLLIPKILLALSLVGDVYILNQINTFYKMLGLILIPLTYNSILSMVWHEITDYKTDLERKSLNVEMISGIPLLSAKSDQDNSTLDKNTATWVYYENILDLINAIYLYQKTRYYLMLSLLPPSLFLCGWGTYICRVIYNKYLLLPDIDFILWLLKLLYIPF